MNTGKIFIIDDERTIRLTFRLALETDGYEVRETTSGAEAMAIFAHDRFDLAVLDLRLGEDSGLDVLAEMRRNGFQTPTLMITAYGSIRQAVRAMQLGAIDFLEKPIEPSTLRQVVAEILERHRPRPGGGAAETFDDRMREAKRLVNLQSLDAANEQVTAALCLNDRSPEAHNLHGVLNEIGGNFEAARKAYGRAIRLDSNHEAAQQNMRRMYELCNFGSSAEPLHLGDVSNS